MHAKPADLAHEETSSDRSQAPPWWLWGCTGELSRASIANARRYLVLSGVWAVSLILTILALKTWGEILGPGAYALALVPTAAFLAVVWGYSRFLREADELTRKIHVEAMAVGFGVGLVCILGYPILESAGAPVLELGHVTFPMVLAYSVATIFGQRRYR